MTAKKRMIAQLLEVGHTFQDDAVVNTECECALEGTECAGNLCVMCTDVHPWPEA
jgi:hypothetical protein